MENQNKNEEEIPPVTVKTEEEYAEILEKLRWGPTKYKIVEFFVADLMRAERIEDGSHFRFNNVEFKTVKIRGTVVGIGEMGIRLLITVDDGTAQIDCIFTPNEKLRGFSESVAEALKQQTCLKNDSETRDKGTIILLSRCKKKLSRVPLKNSDIKLGDTVVVIGNLSEYYENRNVFIKHVNMIEDCNAAAEADNLKRLFNVYENMCK